MYINQNELEILMPKADLVQQPFGYIFLDAGNNQKGLNIREVL